MSYELIQQQLKEAIAHNEDLLEKVKNADTAQHILFMKSYASKFFETEKCGYDRIDGKFYFTEAMVNKLMSYAYSVAIEQVTINNDDIKRNLIDELIYQLQEMK